ncbi:RND transporter [Pandoraea vervacti]|uniref:RND transporter n=1 Tax=Pandoraea vervacti TaxID=656178 RepID=A0ABM5SXN4_9BURK|nr:efflux transporter outer membrane subunit [Pandoraea vervacti]AJP57291.1 RND transporter [Pandoraea vervacti]
MSEKTPSSRALALMLVLALAGCVAGPDYRVPQHAVALSPQAERAFVAGDDLAYADAYVDAPVPDTWWTLYDDAQLNTYVAEALRANTDLRVADARLRQASAALREAQEARTIQTQAQASASFAHVGGYTLPMSSTPQTYALGINLSYALDLAGGIRRGIEAANANADAVAAARDQVRVVVAAAVTRAYVNVCSANRTLAATRHVLHVQRQTLDATRKLSTGGKGTAFDVSRSSAAANDSEAAIPHLLAQRQAALFALAALMGKLPADYPKSLENCMQPPSLKQPIPVGDGWQLIRRRPDIREAERRLAAATAMIGVATAQLYPQVSIGASAGFADSLTNLFSAGSFGATLGPLLSWHWPNRMAAKARIEAAGAGADAAFAAFDGAVVQALQQTETALGAYAREIERERSLAKARDDAARASEQANHLFHFGKIGFLDVLSAEAALANAESSLAASRTQLLDRQIDLFLALGGGWSGV